MRTGLRLAVAGAAAASVLTWSAPAFAGTTLQPNTPVKLGAAGSFGVTTSLPYWSAVALRPEAGTDYDLRVVDPATGLTLAGSGYAAGRTDIVAINSTGGHRPLGNYLVRVSHYSGSGGYALEFVEQRVVIGVPTDPVGYQYQGVGLNFAHTATTAMIYLRGGQGFRVYQSDQVRAFLAGSTPRVPGTDVLGRSQLEHAFVVADHVPSPDPYGGYCRVFQVPTTGWYSLMLVWNSPWEPPPYDGGSAVVPQRYDPALGDTLSDCPKPVEGPLP